MISKNFCFAYFNEILGKDDYQNMTWTVGWIFWLTLKVKKSQAHVDVINFCGLFCDISDICSLNVSFISNFNFDFDEMIMIWWQQFETIV